MTVKCSQRATWPNSWVPNINMHLQHHNPIAIQSRSSIKHSGTVAVQIITPDFHHLLLLLYLSFNGGLDQVKEASPFLLLLIVLHPTCVQLAPPFFFLPLTSLMRTWDAFALVQCLHAASLITLRIGIGSQWHIFELSHWQKGQCRHQKSRKK